MKQRILLLLALLALPLWAQESNPGAEPEPERSFSERLAAATGFEAHGFLDLRAGVRTQDDPYQDDLSLAEPRLQLDLTRFGDDTTIKLRADFLYDFVQEEAGVDLERGEGPIDLREAYVQFTPLGWLDVKAGRQILTWGTGNLLFVNDMFPKDWQSFFAGRDQEYLKAPSDAVFLSAFSEAVNVDLAITPRFDADRFIDGTRNSYYAAGLGRRAGQDAIVDADRPDDWGEDAEVAARLYRLFGSTEVALYGYRGYWKSPGGQNLLGQAIFPRLNVYGASARGSLAGGIANAEIGYYDSIADDNGANPFVNNSEFRALVGYERELATDLSGGVQYYLEHLLDHADYEATQPAGMPLRDEYRQVLTLSLYRMLANQTWRLGFFGYYSPTDQDSYLRPNVSWTVTDRWLLTGGANVFMGNDPHTFFGQFEHNTNVYLGARYSF